MNAWVSIARCGPPYKAGVFQETTAVFKKIRKFNDDDNDFNDDDDAHFELVYVWCKVPNSQTDKTLNHFHIIPW